MFIVYALVTGDPQTQCIKSSLNFLNLNKPKCWLLTAFQTLNSDEKIPVTSKRSRLDWERARAHPPCLSTWHLAANFFVGLNSHGQGNKIHKKMILHYSTQALQDKLQTIIWLCLWDSQGIVTYLFYSRSYLTRSEQKFSLWEFHTDFIRAYNSF